MSALHFTYRSFVPVRREASDASEMETQLLFGDVVEVLEVKKQWRRIRILDDGYLGWADEKMFLPVSEEWYRAIKEWEYVLTPQILL